MIESAYEKHLKESNSQKNNFASTNSLKLDLRSGILLLVFASTVSLCLYYYFRIFFIDDYMPSRSDPIGYWTDARAFFQHGQIISPFISDENISKIGAVSVHGPMYLIFYGVLSKIFGSCKFTILFVNFALFVSLIAIVLKSSFLNFKSKLLLLIIQFSYFITWFSMFGFTPEFLHIFFANIIGLQLVACFKDTNEFKFKNLIKKGEDKESTTIFTKDFYLLVLSIVIAACFRYSWVLSIVGILPLARHRQQLFKLIFLCITVIGLGFIYKELFHSEWHGLVMTKAKALVANGDTIGALKLIFLNIKTNLELFFYRYFYSWSYVITKFFFSVSMICLFVRFIFKADRLALSSIIISLNFFVNLLIFFDAIDTRDIRGLTGSFIIMVIVLLHLNYKKIIAALALCFVLLLPTETMAWFNKMVYSKCKKSGELYKQIISPRFDRVPSNGKKVITILISEKIFWTIPKPNGQPLTIKDILHTKALKFPLVNFEGVPIRYTFSSNGKQELKVLGKIDVDYKLTLDGRLIPIR